MKRDLTELSQTVQQDTAAAVNTTAAILKDKLRVDNPDSVTNKAKQGLTTIINTISDVFLPIREIEDDEIFMIRNSQPVLLDRWETQLHAIRTDPNTYCHEPEGPPEVYEAWLETFDLDSCQQELSDIMIDNREVRALYAKLVPAAVSHVEFWQRYYYRVHLLKQTEAKRAEIMKRAETKIPKEESLWDDDDDFSEVITSSSSLVQCKNCKLPNKNEKTCLDDSSSVLTNNEIKISRRSYESDINEHCKESCPEKNKETFKTEVEYKSKLIGKHTLSNELSLSQGEDNSQKLLSDSMLIIQSISEIQNNSVLSTEATETEKAELPLEDLISREKGDMVVVGEKSDISPASSDTALKGNTEDSDLDKDCDWEKDFDLEITDEDLKKLENSENTGPKEIEEGWENWE